MKKTFLIAALSLMLAVGATVTTASPAKAEDLDSMLSGRILIAVQENGEAWYVNPVNLQRYYLGRPADAFSIMQHLGLGVSNEDYNSFNGKAPLRLAGRVLLKVEDWGKAYYIDPTDLKLHFLGSPSNAFQIMSQLGLGITNDNLNGITVYASGSEPGAAKNKNVQISNNYFSPANLVVKTGAMVTWTNNGSVGHTVTSTGNFNSGNIDPGKTYSRMFNIAGTYKYFCDNHPGMTGTITAVVE